MGGLVISRADCRAISERRRTTAHITVVSTVLCAGYVVNKTVSCVLMNVITTTKYVAVLSALNLVSDFVKCNHPIITFLPRYRLLHLAPQQPLLPPTPLPLPLLLLRPPSAAAKRFVSMSRGETSSGARFTNFQELFLTRILNAILNQLRIDS
jgi:hypothetical protein